MIKKTKTVFYLFINGVFNSFISLVPDEIKTSTLTGDAGYDTYLRDAHKQVHTITVVILLA